MEELDEIVPEFLAESRENLDELDRDLLELERVPTSRERLSSVFRTIHTIKGTSGFLAFNQLETLTHAGESLLARYRDGVQVMDQAGTDALLRLVDTVRALLTSIEQTGTEGHIEIGATVAALTACVSDEPEVERATAPVGQATAPVGQATAVEQAAAPVEPVAPPVAGRPAGPAVDRRTGRRDSPGDPNPERTVETSDRPPLGQLLVDSGVATAATVASVIQRQAAGDTRPLGTILIEDEGADPEAVAAVLAAQRRWGNAEISVRVETALLDGLMRLVGELVVTRNQLVRGIDPHSDPVLAASTQRLNLITSELQESVMKTRMQPIDHMWSKVPRVLRDLTGACGKQVRLVMEGSETGLDRGLLEAIRDPLLHLVRNAVDHGVELPSVRTAKGKNPEGTLVLRAYHAGGHVVVEVGDDGAGLDPERIGRVAVDRGLIGPDELARMGHADLLALLFKPGFSTAAAVTNVSGRGVGLDVVKTNIERIGGTIEVDSTPGVGTLWRLTVPLTLAILQVLTVQCGGERYAIPQGSVDELVYAGATGHQAIERVSGAPVVRLRGHLLPLVDLDASLGLPVGTQSDGAYIVVVHAEGRQFGLVVDRVMDTEEIVVKPLSSLLRDIGVYAGATILSDGSVTLILDTATLARRAHLTGDAGTAGQPTGPQPEYAPPAARTRRVLLTAFGDRRVAIPLETILRLEEFPADHVERVGRREVVRHRDQVLPLVRVGTVLGIEHEDSGDTISAVVCRSGDRTVALAVPKIVDIIDIDDEPGTNGRHHASVIDDRVTEVLDLTAAIRGVDVDLALPLMLSA